MISLNATNAWMDYLKVKEDMCKKEVNLDMTTIEIGRQRQFAGVTRGNRYDKAFEIPGRFVEKHDWGVADELETDRKPLLLSAREAAGACMPHLRHCERCHYFLYLKIEIDRYVVGILISLPLREKCNAKEIGF